jgi:hypothetical protein
MKSSTANPHAKQRPKHQQKARKTKAYSDQPKNLQICNEFKNNGQIYIVHEPLALGVSGKVYV